MDKRLKNVESLISLGLHDQFLSILEGTLLNDMPHVLLVPSYLVLNTLLTLSTIFEHNNHDAINKKLLQGLSIASPVPVSLRAIHILDIYYRAATTDQVVENDRIKITKQLINLMSFISKDKVVAAYDLETDPSVVGTILANQHFTGKLMSWTWRPFVWAIYCGSFSASMEDSDRLKYQCWIDWCRILNFLLNLFDLEMTLLISREIPLLNSSFSRFLGQLGTRNFLEQAVKNIFYNKQEKTAFTNIDPVYENELTLSPGYLLGTQNSSDADLISLQKRFIFLINRYLLSSQQAHYIPELASTLSRYVFKFTLDEVEKFFFTACKNQDSSLLVTCALRLLAKISNSSACENLVDIFETGKQSKLEKFCNMMDSDDNLVALLEIEPVQIWSMDSKKSEFASVQVDDDATIIQSLVEALQCDMSYYDKLMKINLLICFLISVWVKQRMLKQNWHESDSLDLKQKLKVTEEFKLCNLTLILSESLKEKKSWSETRVNSILKQIILHQELTFLSESLSHLLE